ncbi:relaxase/mobilization nuclease domain-containing protein [Streptomyces sp. SID4931]|nr:relaxase/mobilization nuclease domain-containing protein [Streptomyces sp. SID4931]SCF97007.1 Relaxase/Mobilisation nuclease domain-containing protein [Streptomyces sp. Ncost-T6T-2b]
MIAKAAKRGDRTYGLLAYLYGPGRANEHIDPHMVAAWSDHVLDPSRSSETSIHTLAQLLDMPVRSMDGKAPAKHVYHLPIRVHEDDRTLTDAEWRDIAREAIAAAGEDGSLAECRWVAVRHADDHIHIVATLARQDGGKPTIHNDAYRLRDMAREMEAKYQLTQTAPADRTTHRRAARAEEEKTTRRGLDETPRETLRKVVSEAAAGVSDSAEFFAVLQDAGCIVEPRTGGRGEVTGYKVGLPEWRTKEGDLIWYSGGRLAPDLSMPKLRQRWESDVSLTGGLTRVELLNRAAEVSARAMQEVAEAARENPGSTPAVIAASADLMTANSWALEGRRGGPLSEAADAFRRAARNAHHQPVAHDQNADTMRSLSQAISQAGRLLAAADRDAGRQLAAQLLLLADAVATLRAAQDARHQAEAALSAARFMRQYPGMPVPAALQQAAAGSMRIMGRVVEVRAECAARVDLQNASIEALGELAPRVLADDAWGALATSLAKAEEAGWIPSEILGQVARSRELETAESVAQVLTWRLENRLARMSGVSDAPAADTPELEAPRRRPNRPGRGRGAGPKL